MPLKSSAALSRDDQAFVQTESEVGLRGLWEALEDCYWVNPYRAAWRAGNKPFQLRAAREVGLTIPPTLITSNPKVALEFWEEHKGLVVYKPFFFAPRAVEDRWFGVYTNLITREHLVKFADGIRRAPCLFQVYVNKRTEFRVTFVGEQMFVCEIDSQASERSKTDWRRYDLKNTRYRTSHIPVYVERKLRELMARLELRFGCADLIETPDGDFVFLEVNESGQWYWVEQLTGLPITEALVTLLHDADKRQPL